MEDLKNVLLSLLQMVAHDQCKLKMVITYLQRTIIL